MIKRDILLAKHNFSELKDLPNNAKIRSLLVQYKIKDFGIWRWFGESHLKRYNIVCSEHIVEFLKLAAEYNV